ncbi:MAG: immunoglobulin domain-containing protein, partial [Odoribacter sp.]
CSGLKYSWTLPDRTVRAKKKIVLPAIGYDNIGHYICRVSGLCGTDILTTDVNMYGQLTVSGNTELHRLCKGESIRLTAISNLPVLRYEWKKEGGVRDEMGGELLVAHLDSLQAGHYECRVVALCDSKPLQYEVRLKESTKITDGTPDVYVNEHGSVRLFVKAVGENNVYEWTEKGMPMGGNSNQLLIQDVGLVGTRTFVCKVSGDCGEDRRSISVYVDRYKVLTKDGAERLCEGSDNAFNAALLPEGCDAATKLSYRWEWKGNRVSSTSVLELKELKVESGGRYSCYIKGECGEAVLNLDVEVVWKPVLRRFPTVVSVCEMGHFSIGAFPEGNDRLAYTWLKGNVPLEGTDSIFRMEAVERKDAGMYTCRVTGQCGVAEDDFRLEVARSLKILDAPDTVKVCAGQSGWLEIVAVGEDLKYAWSGPNQSGWMGDTTFKYSNVSITRGKDEGRYRCVVESRRGCGIDTVYAVVEIEKELKLLSKSPDAVVCQGTKVDLYARVNLETVKYTWILPDGTSSRRKDVSIEE